MTGQTNFGVLLDLLAEESSGDGPVCRGDGRGDRSGDGRGDRSGDGRGDGAMAADRRREVARQVRESTEAQLTLFLLAREVTAGEADTPDEHRATLAEFAESIRDRFGVDLLRVAAEHGERIPGEGPGERLADGRRAGDD